MKKKVFVSYSNYDLDKMTALHNLIKETDNLEAIIIANYKQPMKALTEKVSEGLEQANYIVPILTIKSYQTQWINQEIGYAAALKRKNFIIPLVEGKLIDKLKGFIHSQVDLSYNFIANAVDEQSFVNVAKDLVNALSESVRTSTPPASKVHSMSDVFQGEWQNLHRLPDGRTGSEKVFFKKNDQYWVNGEHVFDLKDIFISEDLDVVIFTKVGVGADRRRAKNKLALNADGSYSGIEDEATEITYKPIGGPRYNVIAIDGGTITDLRS